MSGRGTVSGRGRARRRPVPWDTNNPANWTREKLSSELQKLDILAPASLGKVVLKKLFQENSVRRRDRAPSRTSTRNSPNVRLSNSGNGNSETAAKTTEIPPDTTVTDTCQPCHTNADTVHLNNSNGTTTSHANAHSQTRMNTDTLYETNSTGNNMAAPTISALEGMMSTIQQTVVGLQQAVTSLNMQACSQPRGVVTAPSPLNAFSPEITNMTTQGVTTQDEQISDSGACSSGNPMCGTPTNRHFVDLEPELMNIVEHSVASSTKLLYKSAFQTYISFLLTTNVIFAVADNFSNILVTENLLMYFVTHCHSHLKLSYTTVKSYLCGIKYMCNRCNIPYPTQIQLPRLQLVLAGVKRLQLPRSNARQPVTYQILRDLCIWLRRDNYCNFNHLLFETVSVIAFFGFLRCGEFTVNDSSKFDPHINLCISDLTFSKNCVLLTLKVSKTDPFRQGVTIKLFKTNQLICPYDSCQRYFLARQNMHPSPSDPLFLYNGRPLTRSKFLIYFKHLLQCIGVDSQQYNGHSFRIGAATSAASANIEDHLIKILGRWASDSYCRYIRTSDLTLQGAQRAMTA